MLLLLKHDHYRKKNLHNISNCLNGKGVSGLALAGFFTGVDAIFDFFLSFLFSALRNTPQISQQQATRSKDNDAAHSIALANTLRSQEYRIERAPGHEQPSSSSSNRQ